MCLVVLFVSVRVAMPLGIAFIRNGSEFRVLILGFSKFVNCKCIVRSRLHFAHDDSHKVHKALLPLQTVFRALDKINGSCLGATIVSLVILCHGCDIYIHECAENCPTACYAQASA